MTKDDYYTKHLKFYAFVFFIGGLFSLWGYKASWHPFLVYGGALMFLSFIGMIFFCEDK